MFAYLFPRRVIGTPAQECVDERRSIITTSHVIKRRLVFSDSVDAFFNIGASVAVWQFWGNIEPELDGFLSIDDLFGPKSKSGEAAVLFCAPDQVQTDDALYAVFYDPEFRERIEKVYHESHRDGSPALFNIVRFGTANEVAFQLYWKEPLEWQIKRHGDEIDFKCPRERYFAFHEMRTKYDPE